MAEKLIKPDRGRAEDCAKLLYMAGPNVFRYLFGLSEPETLTLLTDLFDKPGTSYAGENMVVYADEGATMGLILTYPVRDVKTLEWNFIRQLTRIRPRLAARYIGRGSRMMRGPRLKNNELFIGHLAVFPAYRGRGIAAELLMRAAEEAREKKLSRISLFVETDNHRAKRVYERFGFREAGQKLFPKRFQQFGLTGFEKLVKDVS